MTTTKQNEHYSTIFLPGNIPLEMIKVEGGTFLMGSEEDDSEKPIHKVSIPDFYLGKYLVTVAQYLAFVEVTNSHHPEWMEEGSTYNIYTGSEDHYKNIGRALMQPQHPIVGISWDNAVAFCQWLTTKSEEYTYRLPTEAEWEYAARGGKAGRGFRFSGSNKLKEVGWYNQNSNRQTHPVGKKLPNELGLYDMSGNVREWCADHWHENYNGAPSNGSAWTEGGEKESRVVRGGSWGSIDNDCRPSYRNWGNADGRVSVIGFRHARSCPPK